ncbi:MAG: PQQ-binding-like beta-propeller repeat protein [Pirellulales bacterium]|nr:PQQ-binding-like beta-propeller repeat protein [Pirellulales bacterium]
MTESKPPQNDRETLHVGRVAAWRTAAVRSSYVAAVFIALVALLLLWDFSGRLVKDPLDSDAYRQLRGQLAGSPGDAALRETIRAEDRRLREDYFRQRRFTRTGAWLALAGAVVLLVSAKAAVTLQRKLPAPLPAAPPDDRETRESNAARWTVAGLGIALVGAAVLLRCTIRTELASVTAAGSPGESSVAPKVDPAAAGPPPTAAASTGAPSAALPSAEEIAANWPRFRGPGGLGIAPAMDLPAAWDAESGEGICWKAPVSLPGNSSPIVWGDRLFLTGADEQRRVVLCYDAAEGKQLWETAIPATPESEGKVPELSEDTGFAAPTPVTDGLRVYAMFANGDVAAVDFEGKLVWTKGLGIPKNIYGHASSPAMWRDRVIVQFDQATPKDQLSRLIALDAATGETVWSTPREVANSWPSPIVIDHEGSQQIIACSDPFVIAYNPADGKEIWRCKCLRQDVGPSPTYADGILYVTSEFPQMTAIRPSGTGDITDNDEYVLWIAEDNLPDTCSPLATARHVYVLASYGYLTCYDAKSGEPRWEWESDDSYTSSPTMVGDLIYVFGLETCAVISPGDEGAETVGKGTLGEECLTTPAVHGGRMFIRGKEHLFCIGKK